jgi:hypothetical protein
MKVEIAIRNKKPDLKSQADTNGIVVIFGGLAVVAAFTAVDP